MDLSLFLSLYSCQMCYSDFWTLFNWIYIDERWKGTYWKNITHRDKYFPLDQRWERAYAAYGGFLLHYTAGGMYHILEYFLFYFLFTLYVFCGILWVLLLFVYDIVCLSSLSGPLFYFFYSECEIKLSNCCEVTNHWRRQLVNQLRRW